MNSRAESLKSPLKGTPRPGNSSRKPREIWEPLAHALLLIALGIAAYANSLSVPFILDDKLHIVWDETIKPPLSWPKLLANDRPLVSLSLALNYAAGQLNVFGYHVVNLGAHLLCALILYGFARHTLRLPVLRPSIFGDDTLREPQGERKGTFESEMDQQPFVLRPSKHALRERTDNAACDGTGALAVAIAGVFVLHPVQTESVTYVVQRAEIFAALALLAALWIAAAAAQRERYRFAVPALAAVSLFGVFSKESVVVAPALFALYDWCFIARGRARACAQTVLRHWPLYATLLAVVCLGAGVRWWQATHQGVALGGVDLSAFESAPAAVSATDGTAPDVVTPRRYLASQFGVLLYYLRLLLIPNRLCFDCGHQVPWPVRTSLLGDRVLIPALLLAGLGLVALWARRRQPLITFCLLGSAIALAPTSSILPLTDAYVEHRLYLPTAFIALLVVTGLYRLSVAAARLAAPLATRRRWLPAGAMAALRGGAALAILGTLGELTVMRNRIYADPARLWADTVAKAPQSTRALYNLGNEYSRRGDSAQAAARYAELIRLEPGPAVYYVNLGEQYLRLRRNQEAVDAFEQARTRAPAWGIVYRNLTVAYTRVNRLAEAIDAAEHATKLEPLNTRGHKLLGDAYARAGRIEDAIHSYRAAIFFDPGDAEARRRIVALGGTPP